MKQFPQALAGIFRRALHGRFAQVQATGFRQGLVGGLREAVADLAQQADHPLGTGGQAMVVEAGLGVEGEQPQAAAAAVVVSPGAGDRAQEADGVEGTVAVEGGGLLTLGAGHTGADVAVFF